MTLVVSVWSHRQSEYGGVVFGGWARMAQTITSFSIVEVAKPKIGESWPARVRADVTINLNVQGHIKQEWEGKKLTVIKLPILFFFFSFHHVVPPISVSKSQWTYLWHSPEFSPLTFDCWLSLSRHHLLLLCDLSYSLLNFNHLISGM